MGSAEPQSLKNLQDLTSKKLQETAKPDKVAKLIRSAIMDNDFMKNLEMSQINEIVNIMVPMEYAKNSQIIREGEAGTLVYVMEEGKVKKNFGSGNRKKNNIFFPQGGGEQGWQDALNDGLWKTFWRARNPLQLQEVSKPLEFFHIIFFPGRQQSRRQQTASCGQL